MTIKRLIQGKHCGGAPYIIRVESIFSKILPLQNWGLTETPVGKTLSKILSHKDEPKDSDTIQKERFQKESHSQTKGFPFWRPDSKSS